MSSSSKRDLVKEKDSLVQIDEIHLLPDLLHSSLGTERSHVGTNVSVGIGGDLVSKTKRRKRSAKGKGKAKSNDASSTQTDLLKIDIVSQLHVLGVNPEDLESTSGVGDSNVDLSIEPSESSKSRVDGVGSVGGSHDDDVGSSLQAPRQVSFEGRERDERGGMVARTNLETVHEGKKLRNDSSLDLSVGLFEKRVVSDLVLVARVEGERTLSRLGAMESISSMKMIAGEFFSASSNAFLRLLSLSPAILDMISGPLMRKKKAPVSLATARAMRVFPVPGGPNMRIPLGGLIPMDLKS